MALKSTYTIDVDDSQFLAFKKEFDEHKESMRGMVAAWAEIGASINGAVSGVDNLIPILEQQLELLMDIRDNQTATTEEVEKQQSAFDRMRRSTKEILGNIGSMTLNLLKWTSISGIVTGLAGMAAGGFGIGFLAQNAGQQRYTARGMGVSSGAVNAFDVDYAPFGNGEGLLNSVSTAQTSNADSWRFTANGLDPRGDTVENTLALQQRARSVYQQSGGDLTNLQQSLAAQGLDQFFSVQDARRLGSASDEEFSGMQSNIRRDIHDLGASDADLRNWQELNRQIDRAKTSIENTFIRGLAPLTPELTDLSRDLNGLIKDVLADPHIKEGIRELGSFLEEIDRELRNGQLADRFHQFSDLIAEAIKKISPYIHVAQTVDRDVNYVSNIPNEIRSLAHPVRDPEHSPFWRNIQKAEDWLGFHHVSDGMLDAVAQVESNGGKNAGTSRAGARGMFQFMPATAAMYGITNRDDPTQEREGARRYLNDLLKKYHGSAAEALAAYNFGPGNLDRLMKDHQDDWESYLPNETQNYVQKVAREMAMPTAKRRQTSARQRSVLRVQIDNTTGTNVSVGARMSAR